MALFVPGMKCPLCGLPMVAREEVVMFPSFVANRKDPLFRFSDALMHAACIERDPLGELAVELHNAATRNTDVRKRLCDACGRIHPVVDICCHV